MKSNLKRGAPVPTPATPAATSSAKPTPALTLASLLGRAKAMTAQMKASSTPAAAAPVQARAKAPQTTAAIGSIRRLSARTGSK